MYVKITTRNKFVNLYAMCERKPANKKEKEAMIKKLKEQNTFYRRLFSQILCLHHGQVGYDESFRIPKKSADYCPRFTEEYQQNSIVVCEFQPPKLTFSNTKCNDRSDMKTLRGNRHDRPDFRLSKPIYRLSPFHEGSEILGEQFTLEYLYQSCQEVTFSPLALSGVSIQKSSPRISKRKKYRPRYKLGSDRDHEFSDSDSEQDLCKTDISYMPYQNVVNFSNTSSSPNIDGILGKSKQRLQECLWLAASHLMKDGFTSFLQLLKQTEMSLDAENGNNVQECQECKICKDGNNADDMDILVIGLSETERREFRFKGKRLKR